MAKVSIIMSAYNAAATLGATLEALPGSSMSDWEAVIVNDASQDDTGDRLEAFAARDRRVRVLHNSQNMGLPASLNRAIDAARGLYLARLDADDISLPDRLALQCAYLDAHPAVGALGMGAYVIDGVGRLRSYKAPLPSTILSWAKIWRVPFIHPTVMLRRDVLEAYGLRYDPTFRLAQDFELWSRLLDVTEGANLKRPGIYYRVHGGQSTRSKVDLRLDLHRETSRRQLAKIVPGVVSNDMMEAQRAFFLGEAARGAGIPSLQEAVTWRQAVAEMMLSRHTAEQPVKIGFGLDLWHVFRRQAGKILGDSFQRQALTAAMPVLVQGRVHMKFWASQRRACVGMEQSVEVC